MQNKILHERKKLMNFNKLFQNNEKWIAGKLALDSDYFKKLVKGLRVMHPGDMGQLNYKK